MADAQSLVTAVIGEAALRERTVLNAGSGSRRARQLHAAFVGPAWREVRIDVDAAAEPDVVGSIADMTDAVPDAAFDAVWCSHVLEHLFSHEVPAALAEFRRVLRPAGFAVITSPDVEAVAAEIVAHGLDHVVYVSAAGPITPLDILFGHTDSIARGRVTMAHNTGLSCVSLGQRLVDAGFPSVLAKRDRFDLWAVALMPDADEAAVKAELNRAGLDMQDSVD